MTTVLKCFDTPAIGSTVSEHAGPKINICVKQMFNLTNIS